MNSSDQNMLVMILNHLCPELSSFVILKTNWLVQISGNWTMVMELIILLWQSLNKFKSQELTEYCSIYFSDQKTTSLKGIS